MKGAVTALIVSIPTIACCADSARQEFSFISSIFQMIAALALVVGLIFVVWHFSSRFMKGLPGNHSLVSRHIRVVESRYFGPKRALVLVEVGGIYLLLSSDEGGFSLIKEIDMLEEIEVIDPIEGQGGFAAIMARLRQSA